MALALATATARPDSTARPDRAVVPVTEPFDALFPYGGMLRGSVVTVDSLTVALALLAANNAGWRAVAGLPELGLAAAAEAGVDLHRLVVIPAPGEQWAVTVATLLDGVGVVLVRPPARLATGDARRLAARTRERRAVLIALGSWPEQVDLRIRLAASEWTGLYDGHGRLARRRISLTASGRGAAARERRVTAWLPLEA